MNSVASAELTESELIAFGRRIGAEARPPLVIALRGDLGAGKTTLARSIIQGAGVVGAVPSPTYNLLLRYSARPGVSIVHADLYRLQAEDEVWELGWSDLPAEDEILLIEWPERAERVLPADRWEVMLAEGAADDRRQVSILAAGSPGALPELGG